MVALDHLNMSVENLEVSLQWYKRVFNFRVVEKGKHKSMDFAIIRNGESMLCLYELNGLEQPDKSGTHKVYHFGLRVHNRDEWEDKIKKLKIDINLTWEYPHSHSWYLNDPSGHEIEVTYWNDNQIQFNKM